MYFFETDLELLKKVYSLVICADGDNDYESPARPRRKTVD